MVNFCSFVFFLPRDGDVVLSHAAVAVFLFVGVRGAGGGFHSCPLFHRQCTGACACGISRPRCSLVSARRRLSVSYPRPNARCKQRLSTVVRALLRPIFGCLGGG
ncbi:unnamed protein product, partial [Ectocarpus sp. 12 AP-2014]